jgi:F-type H+-transporting ATPase subunit alpha
MSVEQQVMVIYAVTNGHLDQVAVPDIKEWERGFLDFAESQFPQVPQRIRSEKVLSKETEADLKRALENYNQSFGSRKKA